MRIRARAVMDARRDRTGGPLRCLAVTDDRTAHDEAAARVRAWRHAAQAAVCDVLRPWAHGTVARATRYPDYYDFNVVRVEDDPGLGADDLIRFADGALAGLAHRRVDFDLVEAAEPLRAAFEAEGFRTVRLLWMRHEGRPTPSAAGVTVETVPYDAVHALRVAWHQEDFPGLEPGRYHAQAKEVAMRRDVRVLAVHEAGAPVGFAQVEREDAGAEITQVYVGRDHRGRGLGTQITCAAIAAAGDARDIWIVADDEDRPKHLYARLGFRPVATTMEFQRLP
jgi:ribosomal protein S18 acetylase RimI-like enzyme